MLYKIFITMASNEGLGNFIINEDEIRGTTLDILIPLRKKPVLFQEKKSKLD